MFNKLVSVKSAVIQNPVERRVANMSRYQLSASQLVEENAKFQKSLLSMLPLDLQDEINEILETCPNFLDDLIDIKISLNEPAIAFFYNKGKEGALPWHIFETVTTATVMKRVIATIREHNEKVFTSGVRHIIPGTLNRVSIEDNIPAGSSSDHMFFRLSRLIDIDVARIDKLAELLKSGKKILIAGAPGSGKTTWLRSIIRYLGMDLMKRVVVADASDEIACMSETGKHPFLGPATVLRGKGDREYLKTMFINSTVGFTPEVIVCDELWTKGEAAILANTLQRGVSVVLTSHAGSICELVKTEAYAPILGGISTAAGSDGNTLDKGKHKTIREVKEPVLVDAIVIVSDRGELIIYEDAEKALQSALQGEEPVGEKVQLLGHETEAQEESAENLGIHDEEGQQERQPWTPKNQTFRSRHGKRRT